MLKLQNIDPPGPASPTLTISVQHCLDGNHVRSNFLMFFLRREFEKLILGGSIHPKPGENSQEQPASAPTTPNLPQHSTTTQPQPKSSKVSNNNTAEQNKVTTTLTVLSKI